MKKYTCFSLCKAIEKQIPKNKRYMVLIKLQEHSLIKEVKSHVYALSDEAIAQSVIDLIVTEIKGA